MAALKWERFLERREERLARARQGGRALASSSWRLNDERGALEAALRALALARPSPEAAALAVSLAPAGALPAPPPSKADLDEPLHRQRLLEALRKRLPPEAGVEDSPEARQTWAVDCLLFLGEQVEDRERAAWGREPLRPSPREDAEVASLWAGMFGGGSAIWSSQKRWENLLMPPAMASFRQVLSTRELPSGVARQALTDLRDGLWFQLLGGRDSVPGWAELAARVLETCGGVPALAVVLSDEDWSIATGCVAARGTWPDTLGALLSEVPGGPARALILRKRLSEAPDGAEAVLDLHVILRLLETWSSPEGTDPVRSWAVVVQNRGRARARLRALAMARPAAMRAALLSADALHARTLAAMRRYAWDLAWEGMARGFAWDFSNPVTTPCEAPPAELQPLGVALMPVIRTWVLLVVLKGRHEHLQRWVQTGGTGDRDGVWGRLLSEELPDELRDPTAAGSGRVLSTYHGLRAWLADGLDETLTAIRPTLSAIVALPAGRNLARAMDALLRPSWDPRVPFPKAGFPTFQANAGEVLAATEPAI